MKKQTAVEWLIEQWPILESQIPERILTEAKEIEKEQINDACYEGYYQEGMYDTRVYYDKKYKKLK